MDVLDDEPVDNDAEPVVCAAGLKKYFYVIGVVAIMILIGTVWYARYYSQGIGLASSLAQAPGQARVMPVAVNRFPELSGAAAQPAAVPAEPVMVGSRGMKGGFAAVTMALQDSVVSISASQGGGNRTMAPASAQGNGGQTENAIRFALPFAGRSYDNAGSGVIVRNDGYIVTNYHIVQGANSVSVVVFSQTGSDRYNADVVKMDETIDLALLRIQPRAPLTAVVLGDSSSLRVADEVIAIGSPYGLDQTVSRGIVSSLHRSLTIEGVNHQDLIQTDAAINQGNSGGPLVAIDGTVIGINTAIYTPTGAFAGIGFAIPSNQVRRFVADEIVNLPGPRRLASGQPVALPAPGSGAVGYAGPTIVAGIPSPHRDGREKMDCTTCHQIVRRAGASAGTLAAAASPQFSEPMAGTLAMNVATAVPSQTYVVMGAGVLPIDAGLGRRLGQPSNKGVFVSQVVSGSPADKAGLKAGDIVLKVDGQWVRTPSELGEILTGIGNGRTARMGLLRAGDRMNLDFTVAALAPSQAGTAAEAPATAAPLPEPGTQPVPKEFNWSGMEIEVFTRVTPAGLAGAEPVAGAEVGEVVPGSLAAKAGLLANDVIVEINRNPVGTPTQMNQAIQNSDKQTSNLLRMMRSGREFYVVLQ